MPLVVPVMRYVVVGVVVVEDILARRKKRWFVWGWMWLLSMWMVRYLLDPIVGSAYACLPTKRGDGE